MKLNLPLMGATLGLALGLNAQTGRNAVTVQPMNADQAANSSEKQVFPNRGCGTPAPSEEWNAWFNQKVEEHKADIASGKAQVVNYTIPVIVHVIHTGQAVGTFPNISQAQIKSQITVLNQDYSSSGLNVGNLPAVFDPARANTGLTFCLATLDPNGNVLAEPGIERISATTMTASLGSYPSKDPANTAYNTTNSFMSFIDGYIKPNTIWDPHRYMNIWITHEQSAVGLLGYATFPVGTGLTGISGNGSATTDGLWCWSKAFGSNSIAAGTYDPTYNKGRTAVHEIGHWVGLRHTWGDGTCATDYCADTPPSQTSNFGCPVHPYKLGTCSGNTTGEMFQNFMDYTDDPCMYIFTNNQATRIQTAMQNGTYRSQLNASSATLCAVPAAAPLANLSLTTTICKDSLVIPHNYSWGGNPGATFSWSVTPSTATFNPNNTAVNPTMTFGAAGVYTVTVVATNSVGASTAKKVITVNACSSVGFASNSVLANNISLSPNPSTGIVSLIATLPSTQSLNVTVYNALGQLIINNKYNAVTANVFNLDLTSSSNGVYFVTIDNGQEKVVKRLIINK